MRIAVGSGNPVKRRAVETAVATSFDDPEVVAEPVDSGVSEQPHGHEETVTGAETRAQNALVAGEATSNRTGGVGEVTADRAGAVGEATADRAGAVGEYDLGVGLEGGVARFDGTEGLFLVMWAAVTDGEKMGHGSGPSFRLPDSIAERVDAGEELGPVMDDVLGEDDVAKKQGAAGALSAGVVDRDDALAAAVAAAMGPFVTEHY